MNCFIILGGGGVNVRACCDMKEIWFAQFTGQNQLSHSTSKGWMSIEEMSQSGSADIFRVNDCPGIKELIFGDAYKEANCQVETFFYLVMPEAQCLVILIIYRHTLVLPYR